MGFLFVSVVEGLTRPGSRFCIPPPPGNGKRWGRWEGWSMALDAAAGYQGTRAALPPSMPPNESGAELFGIFTVNLNLSIDIYGKT